MNAAPFRLFGRTCDLWRWTPAWLLAIPAWAQNAATAAPDIWHFKLTPSVYATTGQTTATDVNLRANWQDHAVWLGQYQQNGYGQQTRAGYEYTASTDWGQVVPSVQAATGGFAGGSVNLQIGQQLYGIVGLGRTNVRNYYNLNFDPNDAITLGAGGWWTPQHQWSLFRVQDDRLQTGQKITHLVWRYHPTSSERLSIDLARKQGRADPDSSLVRGHSLTVGWDWQDYFVRAAIDQKVNFTTDDQKRLSVGYRF